MTYNLSICFTLPLLLFLSSDGSVIGAWSHKDTNVFRLCWPWQWVKAACSVALLISFQMSLLSNVRKVNQDPMTGKRVWLSIQWQACLLLGFLFQNSKCFLLLSGSVQLGDRSAPNAPVILFLCTIPWDNKSMRQEVCVYIAPAALLAGLILRQHSTVLTCHVLPSPVLARKALSTVSWAPVLLSLDHLPGFTSM